MKTLVVKFGGSCLANPEKIKKRAQLVHQWKKENYDVIVVVSAMGQTTNELVKLAYQVSEKPQRRELDMLLTTGERVSMALMSMVLNDMGCPAISFTGSQAGILTESHHNDAKISELRPIRVEQELKKGNVVIVAGFQGVNPETKEITTIGRGGSDTTAMAFAKHFKAECRIFKDVPGICNADPNLSANTKTFVNLSHQQMLKLCLWGSQVLHIPAVELALEMNLPYSIVNANNIQQKTDISDLPAQPFETLVTVPEVYLTDLSKQEFFELLDSHSLVKPKFLTLQNFSCFWGNLETLRPILKFMQERDGKELKKWSLINASISKDHYKILAEPLQQEMDLKPHQIKTTWQNNDLHILCEPQLQIDLYKLLDSALKN
jgi:uridylate kinase